MQALTDTMATDIPALKRYFNSVCGLFAVVGPSCLLWLGCVEPNFVSCGVDRDLIVALDSDERVTESFFHSDSYRTFRHI